MFEGKTHTGHVATFSEEALVERRSHRRIGHKEHVGGPPNDPLDRPDRPAHDRDACRNLHMKKSKLRQLLLSSLVIGVMTWCDTAPAQNDIEDPSAYPGSWYRIVLSPDGEYVTGDGDGYSGGTWYHYPETGWWRQWFYNGPYDSNRKGYLLYEVYIKAVDPTRPTYAEVYFNWATPEWSQLGRKHPPLPDDAPTTGEEFAYMSGEQLHLVDNWFIGTVEPIKSLTIEEYNPEWVSIDVRGRNAYVYRGAMHQCLAKEGACCHRASGDCFQAVEQECPLHYEWLGPGTACTECTQQVAWLDFGDAPDTYRTYSGSDGARHAVIKGVHLGGAVDSESNGRPALTAMGDDVHGEDDEDGVVFAGPLAPGQLAAVKVTASTRGYLNAWVDFDQDGSFGSAGEQIFTDEPLTSGLNNLSFRVPAEAVKGQTFARFRFNTRGLLTFQGLASDGEVEDYKVAVAQFYEPQPIFGRGAAKWSQPPERLEPAEPYVFNGWDELSSLHLHQIVADDWRCEDDRPVTGFQWWGSFEGWTQSLLPSEQPLAFHIGIWTDRPARSGTFGHPDALVWETYCTNWTWNVAGYDSDRRGLSEDETCFQFTCLLSQDQWFYQDRTDSPDGDTASTVYWLSIAAIYDTDAPAPQHAWGWATRPHSFNNAAVRVEEIRPVDARGASWPPSLGCEWLAGELIRYPQNAWWDLAFELLTNQGSSPGDLGLAPVYRFWSDRINGHFYTISESEKNKLIADFADAWTYEGIAFYAYPPEHRPAGAKPVYRFWSDSLGRHFYSMSEDEKAKLIESYSKTWAFEGVAWHAFD